MPPRSFLTLTACDTTPTAEKGGKKGNIKTCRRIDGGGGWGGTLSANITKGSDRTNVNGQKEGMTHLTAATGSFLIASSQFKETRSTLGQWSEDELGYLIWHCGYQLVGEKTGATQKQEMLSFCLCVCRRHHMSWNYCTSEQLGMAWLHVFNLSQIFVCCAVYLTIYQPLLSCLVLDTGFSHALLSTLTRILKFSSQENRSK